MTTPSQKVTSKSRLLVLVTPERSAVDEFIHHNYPGISVRDVLWIKNTDDLYKVRGFELGWERVHFLHRSYEIENAKRWFENSFNYLKKFEDLK